MVLNETVDQLRSNPSMTWVIGQGICWPAEQLSGAKWYINNVRRDFHLIFKNSVSTSQRTHSAKKKSLIVWGNNLTRFEVLRAAVLLRIQIFWAVTLRR